MYTPIGLLNRGRGIFHKQTTSGSDLGDSVFFWVREGDLVFSGQFAWEGAVSVAQGNDDGCIASHRYPIFVSRSNRTKPHYLQSFFRSGFGQLILNHHSRGAAGRNRPLNTRTLIKEKVPLPTRSLQDGIEAIAIQQNILAASVKREVALILEYRARLIADVVTGKFDVRKAAAQLPKEAEESEPIDPIDVETDLEATEAVDEEVVA